jgi:hypothetical protein
MRSKKVISSKSLKMSLCSNCFLEFENMKRALEFEQFGSCSNLDDLTFIVTPNSNQHFHTHSKLSAHTRTSNTTAPSAPFGCEKHQTIIHPQHAVLPFLSRLNLCTHLRGHCLRLKSPPSSVPEPFLRLSFIKRA